MRALREERGYALKDLAGQIGHDFSTLARYERGEWPFPRGNVAHLLDIYAVYDEVEREDLLALAENALVINHWHQPAKKSLRRSDAGELITEDWLIDQTTGIQTFVTTVLPVYLRTEAYAAEVISPQIRDEGPSSVRQAVHHAMQQRAKLSKLPPTSVQTLIDESLLYRMPGNKMVVREQLEQLALVIQDGRTDLRIVPSSAWSYDGAYGAFTIYGRPEPYTPVACVHHAGGYLIIEHDGAARYLSIHEELSEIALSAAESAHHVEERVKELS